MDWKFGGQMLRQRYTHWEQKIEYLDARQRYRDLKLKTKIELKNQRGFLKRDQHLYLLKQGINKMVHFQLIVISLGIANF